jgi:hypothetical protein
MFDNKNFEFLRPAKWIGTVAAVVFLDGALRAAAQEGHAASNAMPNTNSAAMTDTGGDSSPVKKSFDMRAGPFDFHPRLSTGFIYDDNILLASTKKEADVDWTIQPGIQAVAGDDAALITYRDQNYDVLSLSPGNLVIQPTTAWPGKLLLLDYSPRVQIFDKYSANNSVDEFATFNLLMPLNKLILSLRQDYQLQKTEIIEFNQRATLESITTTLSAAYQIDDKTSLESDFHRVSIGYDQAGLVGYTEYNMEDWFNYAVAEDLPISLGVLGGEDVVANHQDQTFEQLRARARYSYTEKLAFDVSAGGELREYEDGNPDKLFPVFSLSALYRPAERTSVSLTGFRQQYASIYNTYNYDITAITLGLQQGITERFSVGLSAGYYSLGFTPITGGFPKYSGDYYLARIGLNAKIIQHLTGQIFYQYLSNESQIAATVNDNQIGVTLTLSY